MVVVAAEAMVVMAMVIAFAIVVLNFAPLNHLNIFISNACNMTSNVCRCVVIAGPGQPLLLLLWFEAVFQELADDVYKFGCAKKLDRKQLVSPASAILGLEIAKDDASVDLVLLYLQKENKVCLQTASSGSEVSMGLKSPQLLHRTLPDEWSSNGPRNY